MYYICRNGEIQSISRLNDLNDKGPRYLLGPGPSEVQLYDLILEQYDKYMQSKTVLEGRTRQ